MHLDMTFRRAAEHAASVERAGNYQHAASLWVEAESQTAKTVNRVWCQHRRAVCSRLHKLRKEGCANV